MHEMSLCEGVIQIIEDQAREARFERVRSVHLDIGALAGVEIEAMRFCFDVVCRGTIAEGSHLEVIESPGTAWCMQCAQEKTVRQRHTPCPDCGSYQLQVTGGDEMKIKELEII